MKVQIIFTAIAILSGALASPFVEVPETRLMSTMVIANLSVTTAASCVTDQSFSLTAVSNTYFSIWLSLFNLQVSTQYYFFYNNYAFVGLQIANLVTVLGWTGPLGQNYISNTLTTIIDTLNTGNSYYAVMDPVTAAAMTTNINELITFQAQIETEMTKCVKTSKVISNSCPDTLCTQISQFVYQASGIMRSITTGWCGICTTDTTKCAVGTTSTTTTTTTTTTESTTTISPTSTISSSSTTTQSSAYSNYSECLSTIDAVTLEASDALSASFWQLNINLFPIAITVPYYFFNQNVLMAAVEGTVILNGLGFVGDLGCNAIEGAMNNLIYILMQACEYIQFLNPTLYVEVSAEIQILFQIRDEVMSNLHGCKNNFFSLFVTCSTDNYWKFSQFIYKFAFWFNKIIVSWCDICSNDIDFCENPVTTTIYPSSSSSSSTISTDSTSTTIEP